MVGGRENFAFFDGGGKSTDWSDIVVLIDVLQIVGVRFQWKPDEMQFFDKMSQNCGWSVFVCLFLSKPRPRFLTFLCIGVFYHQENIL